MALLLLAVLTIYFLETDQLNRRLFFYPALALLLLAFFRSEIGVPAGVFVGLAATLVLSCVPKGKKWMMVTVSAGILLMFLMSGSVSSYIGTVARADSLYGISQEEIQVMDTLLQENDVECLIAPKELLSDFSAYSSRLHTVYEYPAGGNAESLSGNAAKIYQEMQKHDFDTKALVKLAREEKCNYIILDTGYHYPSVSLEDCGFERTASVGGYDIYKDVR